MSFSKRTEQRATINRMTYSMTSRQVYLDSSARADEPSLDKERDDGTLQIAPDVAYRRLMIVNVVFYGVPGTSEWVLIDTGVFGTKRLIESAASQRFGPSSRATGYRADSRALRPCGVLRRSC